MVKRDNLRMKYVPTIIALVVQQLAMIFFMTVVRPGLYVSALSAAGVGLAVYFSIGLVQRRIGSHKGRT